MPWFVFFFHFPLSLFLTKSVFCFNDFTDNRSIKPLLSLVNSVSLDRILRSDVNVNKVDGQLRAAHLILGYTPISCAFQALKCVIRVRDPRLHCIGVTYEGFMVLEGITISEGTPLNQPLFVATPSVGASSTQPVPQEEEEEEGELKEEEEEKSPEEVVDLSESSDEFEVFNRTQSLEDILDEMGIQRKPQKSLMELIEHQPRRGASRKSTHPKLPPPTKSPLPPPQPSLPSRTEHVDSKRKREQKSNDVMETGRSHPTYE